MHQCIGQWSLAQCLYEWAVVGCFGDNLDTTADTLIGNLSSSVDRDALKQLGICVNYNAYGSQPADLHFHPADLYRRMQRHTSPTALLQDDRDLFETLGCSLRDRYERGPVGTRAVDDDDIAVVSLPDEAWARRVSGVYGNDLANQSPEKHTRY